MGLKTYCSHLRRSFLEDLQGWIICIAVLVVTIVRSGITYSFGAFIVALKKIYHTSVAEQNWIGTLSFTISLTCAPFSVTLIRWLSPRNRYRLTAILGIIILAISCMASSFAHTAEMLFFTHSLLYGIGSSLIYMASSLIIGEYFDKQHKNHVLATSILLCGYPLGSLIFNPINSYIVESTSWEVAFRISSALILIIGLGCAWCFKSRPEKVGGSMDNENPEETSKLEPSSNNSILEDKTVLPKIPLKELRSKPEIILWLIAAMFTYLGFYMPFLNLEYYMKLKGISQHESGWSLFLLSLFETISYVLASLFGDYVKGRLVYTNLLASVALAIICVIWPSVDVSYASICVISSAMGFFLGLTIVYTYAESGEVTNLPLDIAWAHTNLFSGLGILISPFCSGLVFDIRQDYDDVFYTVGAIYAILSLLFVAIIFVRRISLKKAAAFEDDVKPPDTSDYNEIKDSVADGPNRILRRFSMKVVRAFTGKSFEEETESVTAVNGNIQLANRNYNTNNQMKTTSAFIPQAIANDNNEIPMCYQYDQENDYEKQGLTAQQDYSYDYQVQDQQNDLGHYQSQPTTAAINNSQNSNDGPDNRTHVDVRQPESDQAPNYGY